MKKTTAFLVFAIFMCVPAFSAEKITIAVMDLEARGLPESEAEKISLILRNELSNFRNFLVLDRTKNGAGATACSDIPCAVQTGKQMGARKVLIGSLLRLGEQLTVTCRIIDVEKGAVDFAENERALFQSDELYMVERFCDKITRRITGEPLYTGEDMPGASGSAKNNYTVNNYSYRPAKDPTGWLALGSGVVSTWGFFVSYQSYEFRTAHYFFERTGEFLMMLWLLSPSYSTSMLAYSFVDSYASRRRSQHRAAELRDRNYYISAGIGGFSALMLVTFIGRNIAHAVSDGNNAKAGDVSFVVPASYEESSMRAGQEQFAIGLGLSMKF